MAYLGRGLDKISNIEVLDNITFDGSSSYSITKGSVAFTPNSAQSCLISIDGVVQATNFTVSSSTINFGVAVPSTSTCNFFLHYGTGVMTVPSDGSVTTAKLADSSVSLAKLTATGTKDATTFLRGDNTFNAVGASNAFLAKKMSGNASGTLVFTNEVLDDGGNYNTSNGRYVVPSDGKYIFFFHALSAGSGTAIFIQANGSTPGNMGNDWGYTHSGADPDTVTVILDLSQNDYVTAVANSSVLASYCWFGGAKLY
jgi:hypothetical protein